MLLTAPTGPTTAAVAAALIAVTAIAALAAARRRTGRDPQRAFTAAQRNEGRRLAGGRCEMESLAWLRCRGRGAHADHWYPWARGGASTSRNLVWACARHNLRKSARTPTPSQTWRLARRRTRYYPPGAPTRPGEWFNHPSTPGRR